MTTEINNLDAYNINAAAVTAEILLEIKAIHFNPNNPFTLSSGLPSPVYIDCRKLLSFPRARGKISDLLVDMVNRNIGFEAFDNIAGGETAGIPFAAFVSERMNLPMTYVRKKSKGYGKDNRIEGQLNPGDRTLLVEDLATDGTSKLNFSQAIRNAGGECIHTAVIFYYNIFPNAATMFVKDNLKIHFLTCWADVMRSPKIKLLLSAREISEVQQFLTSPSQWQEAHMSR